MVTSENTACIVLCKDLPGRLHGVQIKDYVTQMWNALYIDYEPVDWPSKVN